jgi:hypothetical protein
MDKIIGSGMCCVDCLMWLANGDTDPEWTVEQETAFLADIARRNPAGSITLGMVREEHSCLDEDGNTEGDLGGWCDCEELGFSWSGCDVCGSTLGGDRHAVTFWAG